MIREVDFSVIVFKQIKKRALSLYFGVLYIVEKPFINRKKEKVIKYFHS
jgi:hypothetical protein